MLAYDSEGQGKPKTGSFADFLSREKGIEYLGKCVVWNTDAMILDLQEGIRRFRWVFLPRRSRSAHPDARIDLSPAAHCLNRVVDEIREHVLDLRTIDVGHRRRTGAIHREQRHTTFRRERL